MSSTDLIREPAWRGLAPGLPAWSPVPVARAESILGEAGLSGRLFESAAGGVGAFFKVAVDEGPDLFLKHVPPSRARSEERAQEIARWLAGRGVPVAVPCAGYPRQALDGSLYVAMPYIDGRRLDPTSDQLRSLGRVIANLHQALRRHPDVGSWSSITAQRLESLQDMRHALATRKVMLGPCKERLAELAADESLDFVLPCSRGAPLHGDLNPGNVLVDISSGEPILLDFEDVFHSFLPPVFEFMLVVERFVLARVADEPSLRNGVVALVTGYREAGGHPLEFAERPAELLRALSLRSLCVLGMGAQRGVNVGADEWRKFFSLEEAARRSGPMINRVIDEMAT